MEATDIFQFIGRFADDQLISVDSCHFIVRYWNETMKRTGLEMATKEEGYLSITDFAQMVLPQENEILRAIATQRETQPVEDIDIQVERQLAVVL